MPNDKTPILPRMQPAPGAELRRALARLRKTELIELLIELAQGDRGILRELTARLNVATTAEKLVSATRQTIADATAFNKRDINHNFAYDDAAYRTVKRNLSRMIDLGELRPAHGAWAGVDEARQSSGRNERRRVNGRGR